MAADDGQDDQEQFIRPYIRRLEEGTVGEEEAIFSCVDGITHITQYVKLISEGIIYHDLAY